MEMHIGLSEHGRQKIGEMLSSFLADTYAVYLKTQNFHWNVTGPQFFALHVLFEKQYSEIQEAIDEIAERIRALGFYVDASFSGFKGKTSIADEQRILSAKDGIQELVKAHEMVICHARKLADLAERELDAATVDLMGRRLNVHEKFAWMLRSHL